MAHVSFFESGRAIVTQAGKPILIFKNQPGLVEEIEACGFDIYEIQTAMNLAAEKHNGISWDLVPSADSPVEFNHEKTGANIFTDRGKRISFDRVRVTDEEIMLALAHAEQKFGGRITLTGEDQAFTERMARLADDMGIAILNPEMQPFVAAHRESLAKSAPSFAPPKTSKKGFWRRIFSWPN